MSRVGYLIKSIFAEARAVAKEKDAPGIICAFFDIIYCGVLYGASPQNYYKFDFYRLNAEKRRTYVTNKVSEKLIHRYNQDEYRGIFEDKVAFAKKFSNFFKRTFISYPASDKDTYESFKEKVKIHGFICKPLNGSQGRGIVVYRKEFPEFEQLKANLGQGEYILEELIQQHNELNAFYDKAVNCIRVITVYKDGKCHPIVANITFGSEYEIANASYGGITVVVDVNTGKMLSDGGQYGHKLFVTHPYSGKKFKGEDIPFWKETIEMLEEASAIVPQVGYVGWDIAITPDGPVIIEGNTSPGYTYFQIPQLLKDGIGTKDLYNPYF